MVASASCSVFTTCAVETRSVSEGRLRSNAEGARKRPRRHGTLRKKTELVRPRARPAEECVRFSKFSPTPLQVILKCMFSHAGENFESAALGVECVLRKVRGERQRTATGSVNCMVAGCTVLARRTEISGWRREGRYGALTSFSETPRSPTSPYSALKTADKSRAAGEVSLRSFKPNARPISRPQATTRTPQLPMPRRLFAKRPRLPALAPSPQTQPYPSRGFVSFERRG